MHVTFENITIIVRADSEEEAYSKLSKQISGHPDITYATDAFITWNDNDQLIRKGFTSELDPKE